MSFHTNPRTASGTPLRIRARSFRGFRSAYDCHACGVAARFIHLLSWWFS